MTSAFDPSNFYPQNPLVDFYRQNRAILDIMEQNRTFLSFPQALQSALKLPDSMRVPPTVTWYVNNPWLHQQDMMTRAMASFAPSRNLTVDLLEAAQRQKDAWEAQVRNIATGAIEAIQKQMEATWRSIDLRISNDLAKIASDITRQYPEFEAWRGIQVNDGVKQFFQDLNTSGYLGESLSLTTPQDQAILTAALEQDNFITSGESSENNLFVFILRAAAYISAHVPTITKEQLFQGFVLPLIIALITAGVEVEYSRLRAERDLVPIQDELVAIKQELTRPKRVVATKPITLREAGESTARKIVTLPPGIEFIELDRQGKWRYIKAESSSQPYEGWAYYQRLRPIE